MTREESWQVSGATLAILQQIASLGFVVSVFRIPASMLGTIPATVEMHAINNGQRHAARVFDDDHADPDYTCACLLADDVGIDLEG